LQAIDILQIISASIVGGGVVILATYLAERLGSRIGGVVGGFPTTLLVTSIFLIYGKDAEFAKNALGYLPASLAVYGLTVFSYYVLSKDSFIKGAIGSFILWLLGVLILRFLLPFNIIVSISSFIICFLVARFGMAFMGDYVFYKGEKVKYRFSQLFLRGLCSGLVVGLCVFFSKITGPEMSGIFAAFPVATYSSFTIAYWVRGLSFARSLALPFIVAGMWNSCVFAVIVHYLLIPYGTTLSISIGLLGSVISAYVCLKHLERSEKFH
jgi:hypothetical protein